MNYSYSVFNLYKAMLAWIIHADVDSIPPIINCEIKNISICGIIKSAKQQLSWHTKSAHLSWLQENKSKFGGAGKCPYESAMNIRLQWRFTCCEMKHSEMSSATCHNHYCENTIILLYKQKYTPLYHYIKVSQLQYSRCLDSHIVSWQLENWIWHSIANK